MVEAKKKKLEFIFQQKDSRWWWEVNSIGGNGGTIGRGFAPDFVTACVYADISADAAGWTSHRDRSD